MGNRFEEDKPFGKTKLIFNTFTEVTSKFGTHLTDEVRAEKTMTVDAFVKNIYASKMSVDVKVTNDQLSEYEMTEWDDANLIPQPKIGDLWTLTYGSKYDKKALFLYENDNKNGEMVFNLRSKPVDDYMELSKGLKPVTPSKGSRKAIAISASEWQSVYWNNGRATLYEDVAGAHANGGYDDYLQWDDDNYVDLDKQIEMRELQYIRNILKDIRRRKRRSVN